MRILMLSTALLIWLPNTALAQDWVGTPADRADEGILYRQADGEELPFIQVLSIANIEAACFCDFDTRAGDTFESQIEFALSTIPVDAYDLPVTKHNSTLHIYGEGETSDGTRHIMAGFYGDGVRVYFDAPDSFSLDQAKRALTSIDTQGANMGTPVEKIAPKKSSTTGAKLLAGVKRDLETSSAKTKPSIQPAKPKPRSGFTSGAELLAGVRGDVEAPKKARAQRRAIAQKAAREKALREAVISDGYRGPVFFRTEKFTNRIANWVEVAPDTLAPKTNDPYAPQMLQRARAGTKVNWANKRSYLKLLKEAGLTVPKFVGPEKLEIATKMVGGKAFILSGTAKRHGKPVRFFANMGVSKDGTEVFFIYDAPLKQWKDWGGIAVPMTQIGIYEQSEFTSDALAELREMSPKEEVRLFEEHYTGRMLSLYQGISMTNMATLNTMKSFNMSTTTCAGDSNCTVQSDGVGGFEAVITD